MKVKLKFFASLREALGASHELELPEGSNVAAARELLLDRGEPWVGALARQRAVRAAVNQTACGEEQVLREGDELAFFPPVTGG